MEQVQSIDQQTPRRSYAWGVKLSRFVGILTFNLTPFVIVAAFFWLQVQMERGGAWLSKVEIGISVLIELGLVFIWSLSLKHER
jgi:hypothetical protein